MFGHRFSRLVFFLQSAVSNGKMIDPRSHEAAEGVVGRVDDGFTPYVEVRGDQHGTAGPSMESRQKRMEPRFGCIGNRLDPR